MRVLRLTPPRHAYRHGVHRLLLVHRKQTQRARDVARHEVLQRHHRAALHAHIRLLPAVHHLRAGLDLPQSERVVAAAGEDARVVVRGDGVALSGDRRDQRLVSVPTRHTPRARSQRVDVRRVHDVPQLESVVDAAAVQLRVTPPRRAHDVITLQQQRRDHAAMASQHLLAVRHVVHASRARTHLHALLAHVATAATVPDADEALSARRDHVVAVVAHLHRQHLAAVAVELLALRTVQTLALALEDANHLARLHIPQTRLAILAAADNVALVSGNVGACHWHLRCYNEREEQPCVLCRIDPRGASDPLSDLLFL